MDVEVWVNTRVTDYDGFTVSTNSGRTIHARTLIWAAGVKGVPIKGIRPEAINQAARILTDRYCRLKGSETIFVTGDAALMEGDPGYTKGHPQVAQVAIQQGKLVGKNLKRQLK